MLISRPIDFMQWPYSTLASYLNVGRKYCRHLTGGNIRSIVVNGIFHLPYINNFDSPPLWLWPFLALPPHIYNQWTVPNSLCMWYWCEKSLWNPSLCAVAQLLLSKQRSSRILKAHQYIKMCAIWKLQMMSLSHGKKTKLMPIWRYM